MVSVLVSGSSGLGSSPGRGHCVVFLGKTLYSFTLPLSAQVNTAVSTKVVPQKYKEYATMPIGIMGSKSLALLY